MTIHDIELDCDFYFEKGEPATQTDPGWPDIYTLLSAELGGVDIVQILDQAIIQELERRAAWG
jgi:hypothetical protein